MSRWYTPEPATHYDQADGHGYAMNDVMDAAEVGELLDCIERSNIVYIKGIAFELVGWGNVREDGTRDATLRIWNPFGGASLDAREWEAALQDAQ